MSKLIISVSENPGEFGETVHNAGFKALGLDYKYVALKADSFTKVANGMRALDIVGCSVSHPMKTEAYRLVNKVSASASALQAVNTVINRDGQLRGFNTDINGVRVAFAFLLARMPTVKIPKVVILGNGAMCRVFCKVLSERGHREPHIYGRSLNKWEDRLDEDGDILINTTPVRLDLVPRSTIEKFGAVIDVIPDMTPLLKSAKDLGCIIQPGYTIQMHQAFAQFELYTGYPAPTKMKLAALEYYGNVEGIL